MLTLTLEGPDGVLLHLDLEANIGDPGYGKAAMIEYQGHLGTYWDWYNNNEVDGLHTPSVVSRWLDAQESKVEKFLHDDDFHGRGH